VTFGRMVGALAALALIGSPMASAAAVEQPPTAADPFPDLSWRLVGPFRAGWATMVEGVPTRPDTFYLAAAGGGLWRTQNAGRTWTSLFDKGPSASIGAVTVAPSDPNTIYIGAGQPEPRYDVTAGLGVFKSTDGGANWTSLGLQSTRYIGRILVDPKDPNTLVVGAQGHFFGPSPDRGVYRSTDGGKSWTQTLKINDWTGVSDLAADPTDPKVIFAGAWEARQYPWQSYFTPVGGPGSAIYKSKDGGVTWARLSGGGWPSGPLGRISVAVAHTAQGTRVYAVIDSDKAGGLWRSDDAGATWAKVNDEDAFTSYYASRITVAPNDPDVVYTVGQSIRRCAEGGKTCEIIRGSPGGDDYHFVWINPLHSDHMATGSDQGAVVSVDGGNTWSDWYNQPTGQFYHLAADNQLPYRIYSGQQDSGTVGIASRSDYGSISFRDWIPVGGDERDYDIPDQNDPNIVYGSGLGGRVSKWDARTGQVQNIAPWPISSYGKRPTTVRYHYNWVSPLVASRTGPSAIYLGGQVVFRSADQGRTWTTISGDLTGKVEGAQRCDDEVAVADAKPCGYGTITAIEPSPRNADEIWVGTDDGLVQLTRDGGAHWSNVTPPAIPLWAKVSTLDVSPLEDGVAYAAIDGQRLDDFQPHVMKTRDSGKTWTEADGGLPRDHFVSVVRADPVRRGLLYAGTDAGAFVSFDDGARWEPLQHNLPTAWVRDLLVHGNDLIAATQGRAIWVLDDLSPLRQIGAGEGARLFNPSPALRVHFNNNHDTPPPPETALGQNPPDGVAIDYRLASTPKTPVVLEIRDAKGALVRRFASDDKPADLKADRYFDRIWIEPEPTLSATPGLHRFIWNLRYPRLPAIEYGYGIDAVRGRGTPIEPEGPFAVPGDYNIVLRVDGRAFKASLKLREDPRIKVENADLAASLALSQKIAAASARARIGYGETQSVLEQLKALSRESKASKPAKVSDAAAGLLPGQAQAMATGLRAPPSPGKLTFEAADGILVSTEVDLESADAAPTQAQRDVVADAIARLDQAETRWTAFKTGDLVHMNTALKSAARPQIVIPPVDKLRVEPPKGGQDLP
jgi:photosystem II stability/assembly factor-like uncharacterized protein